MAVDGVLAHYEPFGDLPVRQPLGEQAQHLLLARRHLGSALRAPYRVEHRLRPARVALRTKSAQLLESRGSLLLRDVGARDPEQRRRQLDARTRGLERRSAAVETV